MAAPHALVIAVGASPEVAAHLRHRLAAELGLELVLRSDWPPDHLELPIAAVVLAGANALDLVADVRRTTDAPLMVVAATSGTGSWTSALEAGADVCVPSSVAAATLGSQLRALLRRHRTPEASPTEIVCGHLSLDLRGRIARHDGALLALNRREFDLLAHLAGHRGEVQRRHELLAAVWGSNYLGASNTVDVHVAWLRQKLPDGVGVRITTVRGLGYRLDII